MDDDASFGRWLQQRRHALDLTQAALAEQVGCTPDHLRSIEADRHRPSREIAERLADVLAIDAAERPAFVQFARGHSMRGRPAPLPPHAVPDPHRPAERDVSLFAATLRQRRSAHDWTQPELARRVGCAVITVQKLEAGALRPSRAFAERLADSLALPEAEQPVFVALARGIALADGTPAADISASAAPAAWTLPAPLTPLIGRAEDVAVVADRLRDPVVRVLTLLGPGGIGKTRLALAVADEAGADFAAGALWVDLAPIRDSTRVASALAQALGLTDLDDHSLEVRLKMALRPKHLLLVLDNVEHVTAAAPLVAELLSAAPRLTVLLTSRVVAGVYGEHTWPVAPLTLPELNAPLLLDRLRHIPAVQLFVERARAAHPAFTLTNDNAAAVSALCHRLDGLPLAIELAAARVRVLPPHQLLAQLSVTESGRLAALIGGPRSAPARHHTLRATLAWSYALLTPRQQRLFRRLGVFVDGCRLDAAATVCMGDSDDADVLLEQLEALLDSSLLQQRDDADGAPRFTMLETIHEYALEHLNASGEFAQVRARHARWFTTVAESGPPPSEVTLLGRWWDRLEADHANFQAALAWGKTETTDDVLVRLALALSNFWQSRGHLRESRVWLEHARVHQAGGATLKTASPVLRKRYAETLLTLAVTAHWQGDLEASRPMLTTCLTIFRQREQPGPISGALSILGMYYVQCGELEHARAVLHEGLSLAQTIGESGQAGWCLLFLGVLATTEGDARQSAALLQQSVLCFRSVGNPRGAAQALVHAAAAAIQLGSVQQAAGALGESLSVFQVLGERWASVYSIEVAARVAARCAEQAQDVRPWAVWASRLFGAAEALRESLGAPMLIFHRRAREPVLTVLGTLLEPSTLADAWDEGRALTLEQALADALDVGRLAEEAHERTPPDNDTTRST